jgi:Zn ribbon nucleic-acid-binding protein
MTMAELDLDAILARLAIAEQERDELRNWVDDLQSEMYVNCVYCGYRYGPRETTPATMADALKAHVESCPKHPMSALKTERDTFVSMLRIYASHDNWDYQTHNYKADRSRPKRAWVGIGRDGWQVAEDALRVLGTSRAGDGGYSTH